MVPEIIQAWRAPASLTSFSMAQWDSLLRQALAANLTASLDVLVREHGLAEQVPAAAARHLAWSATLARRHRRAVQFEIRLICQALADVGAPLILLKGGAYVAAALPAGRGRLFSDIDILLPKACLAQAESALMMQGWITGHHDAYDQRYYRNWMHELPPMRHITRQSMIDVHHAILPPTARVHPDPALLRAAALTVPDSDCIQVLAPCDMVLHSATHLFFDGEFNHGMRDLIDLHRLLNDFAGQPGFWDQLVPRARQLELGRPLFYALRYCTRLLHTPVPAQVIAASAGFAPNRLLLALMDGLFERALLPMHASCATALTGAAHFALYVRGNWLRMPPLLLARHLFHKAFLSPKKTET